MDLLKIQNVSLNYQTDREEIYALNNVDFEISNGEFIAIVGPSGCGKSTLLSIVCGLLKPTSGQILIDGQILSAVSSKIGYMLQKDQLFEWLNVYNNILLGLKIKKKTTKENIAYANELLEKYGIKQFSNAHPSSLSGGMRQRVALIRTLAFRPELLLLDEPFSALDYQTRLNVSDDIYNIIKNENKTAILVTHDIGEAISMADKVIVLSKRPATVKNTFNIHFNNLPPLSRRENSDFTSVYNQIRRELE